MLSHITVGVGDLAKAKAFYDAVLGALGYARVYESDTYPGYGPPGGKPLFFVCRPFDGKPASPGNGWHAAFLAPTRASVHDFHVQALARGGSDEGGPGKRDYGPHYYAAYVRDPWGNKLQAVKHAPE